MRHATASELQLHSKWTPDTFSEPSKDQGDAAAAGRHVHEGWKEPQQHANPANIAGNTDAQQSYGSFAVPDAEKEMQAFQR